MCEEQVQRNRPYMQCVRACVRACVCACAHVLCLRICHTTRWCIQVHSRNNEACAQVLKVHVQASVFMDKKVKYPLS